MLHLWNEQQKMIKATISREPNLNSSTHWFSTTRYIDDKAYTFYYTKGNGSNFYFIYEGKWHRIMKESFKTEESVTRYTTQYIIESNSCFA